MKVYGNGTNVNSNILNLRTKLGLSQPEFIQALEETSGGQMDMRAVTTLSALERGRRSPTVRDVITICKTFGVKMETLCGLTYGEDVSSGDTKTINTKEIPTILNHGGVIPPNMIPRYDGMPVYVVSKSNAFQEGWAILNDNKKAVVFKDKMISINTTDITIYTYPPQDRDFASGTGCQPLSLSTLLNTPHVWVELLGADAFYQGRYNGWYHHAKDNMSLINDANGHLLPYSGLGISYNAYRINTDKSASK